MATLSAAIRPVAAGLAAAFSVRALTQYADSWSDMTSLVRVNIGAHEDAAEVMGRLADIARSTYSSLELTAQGFAQNAFTLNALGKSTKQQLDYTSALNNALVDRKSTRLNSSHVRTSYAVFCLKKKNTNKVGKSVKPHT